MFRRMYTIYCIREKTDILIVNVMIKNLCNLGNEKLSTLFYFIIGVVWGGGWGDRNLNRWNQENY